MSENKLPKPEKGGTPKKITTPGKPGDTGPGGANPARNRGIAEIAAEGNKEHENGTSRSR